MEHSNSITLNNTSFDKFSKRLYQELKKESELSLSKTKEITAKSLGFRNYSGLKDYLNLQLLNPIENNINPSTKSNLLTNFTNNNIVSIAAMITEVDTMWSKRSLILLRTVLSLLDILNIEKNTDNISKYISFDNIFSFYNQTNNEEAKSLLLNYFSNNIPKFDIYNDNNSVSSEQYSYLSMEIIPIIEFLKQVETQDFLMFSLNWLTTEQNEPVTIETLIKLPKLTQEELRVYNKTDSFFERQNLKFYPAILTTEAYDDSWLCDSAFNSIIKSKLITKKYDNYYFSDFLQDLSKVINTEKKKTYQQLLESIKHNYESCLQYSNELNNAANFIQKT